MQTKEQQELTPEKAARKAKQEKLAALRAANGAKLSALEAVAADKRLENEIKLHELAAAKNLTIPQQLDAVWTPSGEMVAVQKPDFATYDCYIEEVSEAKPSERPAVVDKFLKVCIIEPSWKLVEQLCEDCGDVKRAAVNKAIHMHDVARATLEGKS